MNPNDDLNRLDEPSNSRVPHDLSSSSGFRSAERRDTSPSLPDRDVHLLDYIRVLYKRRWMAITVFLLVLGSAAVYTFTATPIYEARTRLLIESDEQNVVTFQQVVDENASRPDYYQTQFNILQSRALARKTLESLNLWSTPPFGGVTGDEGFSFWQSVAGMFYTSSHQPAAGTIPDATETHAQSRPIDLFLRGLSISPIRNSRLVDVSFRSTDPVLATRIVNALAKNYIEQNLEYKFLASREASEWLGGQLEDQRKQVEAAELALQRYREQNDAISLEDSENIVVQKLADLNAAVTRAKMARIEKEALYNQLRSSQDNPVALDTFPAILSNSFIQQQKAEVVRLQREQAQLSEKLGDKHPDMQRVAAALQLSQARLTAEIGKVVQAVRSEYQAAVAQENSLAAALNQQKTEALSMNRKAIDYTVLSRDVQSARQLYDSLLQRAKETGVAGDLRASNIRVVDQAEVPRAPSSPRVQLQLLLAFVGGLLLAAGFAFFFEYLDNRIKTPDEIKGQLGLPHLGMLPKLDPKALKGSYPLITDGVPANFSEAFRALRTNVLFSTAQDGSRSLVVTSTGPGEGKSMVAGNIAAGLAQSGQRVLLVDADMRKPKAHEIFAIQPEPGLSNLLVGQAKASEVVRRSHVPGLWVLPAGRTPPNPAELLGSPRFRDFVASLKDHFDWVIIDSPPVMAVTDASLIAHLATGVLFVVGAEMTNRYAAKAALDQLEHANATFVGAVLNRVDLDRNGYYYSQYYRREYAQYYVKSA